ncbi:MAG: DUF3047 domain-containing protein [Candidatus Omnitrophota bacterium]
MRYRTVTVFTVILVCAALAAGFFLWRLRLSEMRTAVGWEEDFNSVSRSGRPVIPKGWRRQKKLGTKSAVFSAEKDKKNGLSFLHMEADKASATLLCKPGNVDLKKTPVLKWRWRATVLPEDADGRIKDKDDQAIGIYVGTGSVLNQKAISYRWDTETPKGAEGSCDYGDGTVKVKWFTLRNKQDAGSGRWFVEKRDCAEDFKTAWGFYPKKIYLVISCNSQYTGTKAAADLDWIEFMSTSGNNG